MVPSGLGPLNAQWMLLLCVYYWDTYERREIDGQKHITQPQKNTDFITNDDPSKNKKRCAAVPFETGIHFRRKTDFFPEEDTTKSYSGFEPEPTRLQAEGHSHHTGWATNAHSIRLPTPAPCVDSIKKNLNLYL
ncbi:hypothetical protein TNCV_33391 [Trichonephila clavipes]|nr:hypothetical protein TNCV_33391 [Trichonephila clavipes]